MNEVVIYTQAQVLAVREYQGQRVITFRDVDTLHQRPEGTARRNFNANRVRFIEREDYFTITQPDEIRTLGIVRPQGGTPESVTLLTKMGYLMLVKSFTDDLAWMIQRQLVKSYFEGQVVGPPTAPLELPAPQEPDGVAGVAASFLQALQSAIDSGAYSIVKKNRPHNPADGELLGFKERDRIVVWAMLAYKIYAAAVPRPLKRLPLWGVLEMAGTIWPRDDAPKGAKRRGKKGAVIYLGPNALKPRGGSYSNK